MLQVERNNLYINIGANNGSEIFFFLLSATTRVEVWLSQRFSSIQGDPGLVPTI